MSLSSMVSLCGAVGSAVVGGVYTNFSARVMPRLAALPDSEAVETMQRFNRNALELPFTSFFFGTAVASVWSLVHCLRKENPGVADHMCSVGGAMYLMGWVLTIAYNVPRNNRLDAVVAGTAEAAQVWHVYLSEWTSANSVRAALSILGAVGLGAGAVWSMLSASR